MNPIKTPAARLTAESITRSFLLSKKKHLFLTGSRGSGKSTLLGRLASILYPNQVLPGLTTQAFPGNCVMLKDNLTGRTAVIGQLKQEHTSGSFSGQNPTAKGHSNAMLPVKNGFLNVGIPSLSLASASSCPCALVDEIGYLESDCLPFETALHCLLDKKSVLAVLRKQDTPLLNRLKNRPDVFLVDLDDPIDQVGCIIMASGLGRRFGANKLMADFNGRPLIKNILETTGKLPFARRLVVTRHREIADLCTEESIDFLLHDRPFRNDVIRLGLTCLCQDTDTLPSDSTFKGFLFCPADQPLVTRESLETLLLSFSQRPDLIFRLGYDETPGSPILFPSRLVPELLSLPEGKGGSWLAKKYSGQVRLVPVRNPYELSDIDTAEDLKRLEAACAFISLPLEAQYSVQ